MPLNGKEAAKVVAAHVQWPLAEVRELLPELMEADETGLATVVVTAGHLVVPRFCEAQRVAAKSDKFRQRESREMRRALANAAALGILIVGESAPSQLSTPEHTFPETPDSNLGLFTETATSSSAETATSPVTNRDTPSQAVTKGHEPGQIVTVSREFKEQREIEGGLGEKAPAHNPPEGAQAPPLALSPEPSASRKAAVPPLGSARAARIAEDVFEMLHTARKRLQPRARREQLTPRTIAQALRPMEELGVGLEDWERAIAGTYADLRKKPKDKHRYLSLETLSKPANFSRALDNANEHDVETLPADRPARTPQELEQFSQDLDARRAEESKARMRAEQLPPGTGHDSGSYEAVAQPEV